MRKLISLLVVVAAATFAPTALAAKGNDQVCLGLSSGKIDTTGNPSTVTVTAPAGKLISVYCVKAGSANQGNGPVYVLVNPPAASVTFGYPGGKDISHYSVGYSDAPRTTPPLHPTNPTHPSHPTHPVVPQHPTHPVTPVPPVEPQVNRTGFCVPFPVLRADGTYGQFVDLPVGSNLLEPWKSMGIVPAFVDPVTGSQSCDRPAVPATPVVSKPPVTKRPVVKPKPKVVAKPKAKVKKKVKKVVPKPRVLPHTP